MIDCRRVLVVAAHPDDEVLGCGGTIARLVAQGAFVHIALLADGVGARHADVHAMSASEVVRRRSAAQAAATILGATSVSFGDFPDNRMDTVPLLDVVKHVESSIKQHRPDTVFTHHAGDVNIDHRRIHDAVSAACRPQPGALVRNVVFFEVASSTEWQFPGTYPVFQPHWFVDIGAFGDRKVAALEAYAEEMREWPHARSIAALEHLGRWRGATAGVELAEAFQCGRMVA